MYQQVIPYGELGSRGLPQPGSQDAPLSGMGRTDLAYPSEAELEYMGYTREGLNQFAREVEDELVNQLDLNEGYQHRLAATEEILTNPQVLGHYVLDYNNQVDGRLLPFIADLMDAQDQRYAAQQRYHQQQEYQQEVTGQQPFINVGGTGTMVTPEMLSARPEVQLTPMGMSTPRGQSQQYGMQMQGSGQMPQPHPNAVAQTGRPVHQIPQQAGSFGADEMWRDIRQTFNARPDQAWLLTRQLENKFGPGNLGKPLIMA